MKCPACNYIASNKKDICPRCLVDLRPHKAALGLPVIYPNISADQLRAMASLTEFPIDDQAPIITDTTGSEDAPPENKRAADANRIGGLFKRLFGSKPDAVAPTALSPLVTTDDPTEPADPPEPIEPTEKPNLEAAPVSFFPDIPEPNSWSEIPALDIPTTKSVTPSIFTNSDAEDAIDAIAAPEWTEPPPPKVLPQVLEFHEDEDMLAEQLLALLGSDDEEELTVEAVPSGLKPFKGQQDRSEPDEDELNELDFEIELDGEEAAEPEDTDEETSSDSIETAIALVQEATESTEALVEVLATTEPEVTENSWISPRAERLVEELALECALPVEQLRELLRSVLDPSPVEETTAVEEESVLPDLLAAALDALVDETPDAEVEVEVEVETGESIAESLWQDVEIELSHLQGSQAQIDIGGIINFEADRARIAMLFELTEDELNGKITSHDYSEHEVRSEDRHVDAVALTAAIEKIQQEVEALEGNWEANPQPAEQIEEWQIGAGMLTPAMLWRRAAAKLVDCGCITGLVAIYCYWNFQESELDAILEVTFGNPGHWTVVTVLTIGAQFLLYWILASVGLTAALTVSSGQTWGKRIFQVALLSTNGEPLSFWQSLVRALAGPLHFTTFGLSALSALFARKRTLADYLAGSQVVSIAGSEDE